VAKVACVTQCGGRYDEPRYCGIGTAGMPGSGSVRSGCRIGVLAALAKAVLCKRGVGLGDRSAGVRRAEIGMVC
jgi:hypothetical protein